MLKLKKLYSVTLCLVCTGLVASPGFGQSTLDAPGGVDLNGEGYLFNVPDLQPGALGFTNVALTHLGVNIGQLVGHYADGVAITNALDLLPYVGQSLEVTDADGQTMISLSETGIYLYDDVLMEFVPITVTNGQLFFNGNVVGEPVAVESLTLIDESEAASEVILSVDGGVLSVDGSSVNTDDQALSATGLLISLEDGGSVNLSNAVSTLAASQAIANTDDQTLSLSGTTLSIEDGGAGVDLAVIDTDTNLSEAEVDAFVANNGYLTSESDDQTLSLSGTTLTLEDGGTAIDLGVTFATDSELTSVSNAVADSVTTLETTITSGGTTNAALTLADGDGSGASTLTTTNGVLYLNGVVVDTDTTIAGTDDQNLSLSGTVLSIEDGTGVDLAPAITNVTSLNIIDPSTGDSIKLEFINGELQAGGEPLLLSTEKMQQIALALLSYDVNTDGSVDASNLVSGGSGTGAYEFEVIEGGATLSGNTLSWTTATDVPFTLRARRLGDADYFTSLWYSRVYEVYMGPVFPLDQTKFIATDPAAQDYFGTAIAMDGDTFVVGVENDDDDGSVSGSVYIFTYNGSGWTAEKLNAWDAAEGDRFGSSVAIDGDTLVVGAEGVDSLGGVYSGSVYIYERIDGVWTFDEEIYPATQGNADAFGSSVAIDGGTIVVGAEGYNSYEGAAYVYTPNGQSWTEQRLIVPDSADDDRFGLSVAIDGNRIVVGSPYHDQNGSNAGSVYVFTNTGGTWSSVEVLAADGLSPDYFGYSVAVSGDTMAIGASGDDGVFQDSGIVYVYTYDGSSWVEETTLTSELPVLTGNFGRAIALEGDTLVVGEYRAHVNGVADQGATYVFQRSDGIWSQKERLTAADGSTSEYFGSKVALSGSRVLSAASHNPHSSFVGAGAVYLFE